MVPSWTGLPAIKSTNVANFYLSGRDDSRDSCQFAPQFPRKTKLKMGLGNHNASNSRPVCRGNPGWLGLK